MGALSTLITRSLKRSPMNPNTLCKIKDIYTFQFYTALVLYQVLTRNPVLNPHPTLVPLALKTNLPLYLLRNTPLNLINMKHSFMLPCKDQPKITRTNNKVPKWKPKYSKSKVLQVLLAKHRKKLSFRYQNLTVKSQIR